MIILFCNLEKSRKVERVEKSGNAPPGEIGYEKILITDCKCKLIQRVRQRIQEDVVCRLPTVPTQHRPSGSHTIHRHLQEELLFKTILSLSSSCPSELMSLQPHCAEQTWSLTRRAFLWAAQMSCSARVPECQAHQHDCQAYQECYSAKPTSSALLLVFLCQANQ